MLINNLTNEYLTQSNENQYYDRKSAKIKPNDIVKHLTSFANANGGVLAIGIEDDGTVTGFDYQGAHSINDFLEIPFLMSGYANISHEERQINNKTVLLFEIEPSDNQVIKTNDLKVYLRVGDKSKLLNHDQITQLEYDKGERRFEDIVVDESSFEDVNIELLDKYKQILNTHLSLEEILNARALMKNGHLTYAGILLFGKYPTKYLPNARVRLLKFDGNRMETGKHLNIIKDINFENALPLVIEDIKREMHSQLRDFQYLGNDGIFKTIPEYPEFPWLEGIVNAVTHRNYSLQGDYIRVSLYDDRMEIFSPGKLPNIVTLENMQYTRYSRNPRIARILTEFGYVSKLNEGVKRIYDEMQNSFLNSPIFTEPNQASVLLTLENSIVSRKVRKEEHLVKDFDPTSLPEKQLLVYGIISSHPGLNTNEIANILSLKRTSIENAIKSLRKKEIIEYLGNRTKGGYILKSSTPPKDHHRTTERT